MATIAERKKRASSFLKTFNSSVDDNSFARAKNIYDLYVEQHKINDKVVDPQVYIDAVKKSGLDRYINDAKYGTTARTKISSAYNDAEALENKDINSKNTLQFLETNFKNYLEVDKTGMAAIPDPLEIAQEINGRMNILWKESNIKIDELKNIGEDVSGIEIFKQKVADLSAQYTEYINGLYNGKNRGTEDEMGFYFYNNMDGSTKSVSVFPVLNNDIPNYLKTNNKRISEEASTAINEGVQIASIPVYVPAVKKTIDGEQVWVGETGGMVWTSEDDGSSAPMKASDKMSLNNKNTLISGDGSFKLEGNMDKIKLSSESVPVGSFAKTATVLGENPTYYQRGKDGILRLLEDDAVEYMKQDPTLKEFFGEGSIIPTLTPIEVDALGAPEQLTVNDIQSGIGRELKIGALERQAMIAGERADIEEQVAEGGLFRKTAEGIWGGLKQSAGDIGGFFKDYGTKREELGQKIESGTERIATGVREKTQRDIASLKNFFKAPSAQKTLEETGSSIFNKKTTEEEALKR